MASLSITEIPNPNASRMAPIRERQDIYIPGIVDQNISRRNGMVYCLTGSGGSGKSSLLLNMFKNRKMYRGKFDNIFYFCPSASFNSVQKHPFENHEHVYHDLDVETLDAIYNHLVSIKELATRKKVKRRRVYAEDEESLPPEEKHEIEYSAIIIDDFADALKNTAIQKYLNKFIIKARHLCCSFFITLQSYYYCPKMLRKQLTYLTIFKPKNLEEWFSVADEVLSMNREDALQLYQYVFNEPYAHLDVDTCQNNFFKNFNLLEINK